MPTVRVTHRRRVWIALILFPALWCRALIPVGFMPGSIDGLGIAMQLCTSDGLQTVIVDPNGNPIPHDGESRHNAPCVFAASASAAPLPSIVLALAHVMVQARELVPTLIPSASRALVRVRLPRGPPALV